LGWRKKKRTSEKRVVRFRARRIARLVRLDGARA
jgi:hypothetical protein